MADLPVVVEHVDGAWRARPTGPGAGIALLELLAAGSGVGEGFRVTRGVTRPFEPTERAVAADQTNESWVVGETAVVKWATEPLVGPHPDRPRRLLAAGFAGTPRLWGLLEWRTPAGEWVPVASAADLVPGAADGWAWCVDEARAALGVDDRPGRPFAAELGRLTATMHLALADSPAERAPASHAASSLAAARDLLARLSSPLLEACRPRLAELLLPLGDAAGTPLIAVHGDFHVGQLLRAPAGPLYVIDFDGNPTLTPEQRAAQHPAALDVAGMLMSLENVGHVVRRYAPEVTDEAAAAWSAAGQAEFLGAYRAGLAEAGRGELLDESLLAAYEAQQLLRELAYAETHLPRWRYVPEAALRRRFGPPA
ncbi:aminoglycoside phosphotransferase [Frankia sp. CNm7]|uniref:Glucosamine kinase n=1 Tax=Frankia nepalensis TaxID=1836974 RepID=A0A937RK07_9ACTN|nr:aminoglycoside phosphotransferase [Frankia nepalensis]MBL7497814.1 aminoglycoside phosphotransferase [Frankia nepalensis]MBL7512656.1 aminoglycoside phosphotransferase [Frankia nepalensis]MBL7519129.1 aminoglycoside phosphotransferase [Frankia nepalensis]MBL7631715.1 aminoglycoside phosphotransferase [Frankia nepalensis]